MSIPMHEQLKDKKMERDTDRYFKTYRPYCEMLESKSLVSKVRSITQYDIYALGRQLESFEQYKAMCEEDGNVSQLGTIPNVAFDVITVGYGTSPISAMASVQPIDEEKGLVYFKSVIAQNTRGNVTAGQRITNTFAPPDVSPVGYAGDTTSVLATVTANAGTSYTFTLANAPVLPGSVRFNVAGPTNYPTLDDMHGNILGKGMEGSVNYTTGSVVIQFTGTPPADGTSIQALYQTDFEASADIPKILSKLDTRSVSARVFALKNTIGLEQSYALRRRFGMIAEDEVAADLVAAINAEIVNTAIVQLAASATGATTTWIKTAPTNYSYAEYKQTFFDALTTAESTMLGNAGRGTINVMIAGRSACAIISTLPQFTKIADGNSWGPHIYGTVNGITLIRVPDTNILDPDTVLCLYNGTSPFDAALVYAPYMPLVVTTALPNGVNPLLSQKAAAVWAAIDVLVPSFITKIVFSA